MTARVDIRDRTVMHLAHRSFKDAIQMHRSPDYRAVYTFVERNGTPTHIAASTLRTALQSRMWPITRCIIGESLIEALERGDLGVEEPHALRLPESALEAPGVIGEWGDTHISIDGAHRLWRRWKRGDLDFPAYVVPEPAWRAFTIDDMPGSGEDWRRWNRTAQVRTPELEALLRLLGGR